MSRQESDGTDIIIRYLGEGASGKVFDIFCGHAPCHNVVKISTGKRHDDCPALNRIKQQIDRVRNPVHQRILRDHFITHIKCDQKFILMPYDGRCSLGDIVYESPSRAKHNLLISTDFNIICKQVVIALLLFHHHTESAHMDIKLDNILVSGSTDCAESRLGRLKIFDFDLSLAYQDNYSLLLRGTPNFICPLVFGKKNKGFFARRDLFVPRELMLINDLWGLLLSLYIVIYGDHIFTILDNRFVINIGGGLYLNEAKIPEDSDIFFPKDLTQNYITSLRRCVKPTDVAAVKRPFCKVFIDCFHQFFNTVEEVLISGRNGVMNRRESFVNLTASMFFRNMFGLDIDRLDREFYDSPEIAYPSSASLPDLVSRSGSFQRAPPREPITVPLPAVRRASEVG